MLGEFGSAGHTGTVLFTLGQIRLGVLYQTFSTHSGKITFEIRMIHVLQVKYTRRSPGLIVSDSPAILGVTRETGPTHIPTSMALRSSMQI